MCFLCLDGLHIPSRRAHLVLDGELGKRESICHDDMFCVGSMKKWYVGGMRCGDRFSEMVLRWFECRA